MEINAQTVKRAEMVWAVFLRTITSTSIIYLSLQLCLAIICLLGFTTIIGIDSSWVLSSTDAVTFGSIEGLGSFFFLLGGVGVLLCGLLTFVVSLTVFFLNGIKIKPFRGFSLLILTICTVGLVIPVINLFPIMWFWNWYVAWTNLKE